MIEGVRRQEILPPPPLLLLSLFVCSVDMGFEDSAGARGQKCALRLANETTERQQGGLLAEEDQIKV